MSLKSRLIKFLTLGAFASLMVVFIAYRAGLFGARYNSESQGGSTPADWSDTIKKPVRDTLVPLFPGSKSMRLIEVTPEWLKRDSLTKVKSDTLRIKSEKAILSSSKSGKIIVPEIDTVTKKKKN